MKAAIVTVPAINQGFTGRVRDLEAKLEIEISGAVLIAAPDLLSLVTEHGLDVDPNAKNARAI
jgi:hypothetical protein